jgi:hypothetical protein
MEKALIRCIFCKEWRPPTKEHAVGSSLGGDATHPDVCEDCNGKRLSRLDQALAEPLVALSRVAFTPAEAFKTILGGEHFRYEPAYDIHEEIQLLNGFRPVLFPQIHFRLRPDGLLDAALIGSDREGIDALLTFIDRLFESGTLRSLHVKLGPAEKCTTARIVLHRTGAAFLRVAQASDAEVIFGKLEEAWAQIRAKVGTASGEQTRIEHPTINANFAFAPDETYRAIAKTALNVVALRLGAEFALRPEFDELRAYILGNVRHPEELGEGEIAVDTRFVRELPQGTEPLVPTKEHVVTLFYSGTDFFAYITLYARHSFIVKLGKIELENRVIESHEFSTVRTGNRALDITDLYERLWRRRET